MVYFGENGISEAGTSGYEYNFRILRNPFPGFCVIHTLSKIDSIFSRLNLSSGVNQNSELVDISLPNAGNSASMFANLPPTAPSLYS